MAEMARSNSLQAKIEQHIGASPDVAFLTREFANLSGQRQVTRALSKIVAAGNLVRVGAGIYGRGAPEPLTGKPTLAQDIGDVAHQAMLKLRALDEALAQRPAPASSAALPSPGG